MNWPSDCPPRSAQGVWISLGLACLLPLLTAACGDDPLAYVDLSVPGPSYLQAELTEVVFPETLTVGGEQLRITIANPDSSESVLYYEATVEGGPFEALPSKGELQPGETSEIAIRFSPKETGTFSASLSIHHNAVNRPNPLVLPMTGTGARTLTFEGNPLFWGADPAGHAWYDGKMWIYPTTDLEDWDELDHWNAWSSPDLKTWTVHERIFGVEDCDWCFNNAWAPDVAYRRGRYYLYYYFRNDGEKPGGIGVAVSDKPQGPFTNMSTGGPLVDGHDPAVFVDDDGQGYIYAGHMIYFLNSDMVSLEQANGRPKDHALELRGHAPAAGWESLWVFKRDGRYYVSLADEEYRQLRYYIGSSPLGPFDYAGKLLKKAEGINIHHSIVEFGGRWILWYHRWDEEGPGQRRVYGEYLTFNEDGTIQPVSMSEEGLGGGEISPLAPPSLQVELEQVAFGETLVVGGDDLGFPITNPGSSESVLKYEAELEGDHFQLIKSKGSLMPGEAGEIVIRFTPEETGPFTGVLSIYHNAADQPNPLVIPVSGEGSLTDTFETDALFWAADPAGHVWADGQMWIYPTTDLEDWDRLSYWNAWSSPDLESWTVHERIFDADSCGWCVNNAWAPDIAFRNDQYYLYYYFRNGGENPGGIGVAVSDEPQGPFTNVSMDGPLLDGHDPAVFVDDDGQAYIYTGRLIYFLNSDMVSLQQVLGRDKTYPLYLGGHNPVGGWESIWVFKRDGRYYVSLADDEYRQLRYYMGSSPLGPFQYAGTILPKVEGPNVHHSIVPFGDRWVLLYHLWPDGGPGQRRIYREFLDFNEDGTIKPFSLSGIGEGR